MDSNKTSDIQYDFMTPLQYGRTKIVLDYKTITPSNFLEVFDKALPIHEKNASDCDKLIGIFLGKQDILNRPAPNTSNINNKTVVNYAFPITRQIVGYTYGNPVELIQKDQSKQKDVQVLNDVFSYEGVYTTDVCAAIYSSVCGIGYEITMPSSEISKDNTPDEPIVVDYLDPRYTFVVQSTDIGNPQIMSCMMTCDCEGNNKKYIAFTDKYKFVLDYTEGDRKLTYSKNVIGLDPIVAFDNSLFLTGDWEQAISVMDALNLVTSDSLDDIEGTVKSLLVLIGCELDDSETTLKNIKDKRLLSLAGGTESVSSNLDAKFIAPKLDSVSVQNIRDFLADARNVITGIPDRSANSAGGDTGEAVINRDGWTDIEIVAKLKEMFFKKSKKRQVSIAIKILQKLEKISDDLSAVDIDVKIGRHTTDNLGTKTAAFSTLVATGELATIDCLEMSGLTTRTTEVVERGEKFRKERMEEAEKRGESVDTKGNNYNHTYVSTVNRDKDKTGSNGKVPNTVPVQGNSGNSE